MAIDAFQLTGAAAQAYEEHKVPAIFAPLAKATLARHRVGPDDIVLDVACGTGIVARTIRDRFGEHPHVTGIDLNTAMIETARNACDHLAIDLAVGDATSTQFDDGAFTFVICQQGLQFFPNEDAALAEFRRVTAEGGRLVFTVWSRPSPLTLAMANALSNHARPDLAERSLAPFSWSGAETIVNRLVEAGYTDIDLREIEVDRVLTDPESGVPKEIMGTAVGPAIADMGEIVIDHVVRHMLDATELYRHNGTLSVPQHTHLISAVAGP